MAGTMFGVMVLVLMGAGVCLLLAGIIVLVINLLNKNGRAPGRNRVLSIIAIVLGIILLGTSVVTVNKVSDQHTVRCDGEVYELVSLVKSDTFTYKGEKYIRLTVPYGGFIMMDNKNSFVGNAAFKVQSASGLWAGLINSLGYDTMFKVKNSTGCDIYSCQCGTYCKEKDLDRITEYYNSEKNCTWSVAKEGINTYKMTGVKLTSKEKAYVKSLDMNKAETILRHVKDYEMKERYKLVRTSRDGVVSVNVMLTKQQGKWYWDTDLHKGDSDTDTFGMKLPADITKIIKSAIPELEK